MTTRFIKRSTGAAAALAILVSSAVQADERRWTGPEHFAIPLHDWSRNDGQLTAKPWEFGAGWTGETARLYKAAETIGEEGEFITRCTFQLLSPVAPQNSAEPKKGKGKGKGKGKAAKGKASKVQPEAALWLGMKSRAPSPRNVWTFPPSESDLVSVRLAGDGSFFAGPEKAATAFDVTHPVEVSVLGRVAASGDTLEVTATQADSDEVKLSLKLPSGTLNGALSLAARGRGTQWNFGTWDLMGSAVVRNEEHRLGPILWSQYTRQDSGVVKLQAQMVPLEDSDSQTAVLEFQKDDAWVRVAEAKLEPQSSTFLFQTTHAGLEAVPYRVKYVFGGEDCFWEGTLRENPRDEDQFSVSIVNCDHGELFPQDGLVRNVGIQDPDLLFYPGDQFYENCDKVRIIRKPLAAARLSYLNKWYQFGVTWRSQLKDRPSVIIPDDHDVFMGNIWGHGGEGYVMEPEWVNIVHRTMCGTLPDPVDPQPLKNGISVYFTALDYAGMSFAVVADRMFKSDPKLLDLDLRGAKNNPAKADVEGAELLGERQLAFLGSWTQRTQDLPARWFLSQTMFAKANTHTGGSLKRNVFDLDNNGWPQSARARARALRTLGRDTVMLHGDQHIGILARMGIDAFDDGPLGFMVTGASVGFPRAWWPEKEPEGGPINGPYTGRFFDDLGNRITIHGVTNPDPLPAGVEKSDDRPGEDIFALQNAKGSGHGLVTVNKKDQTARFEAFHLDFDAARPKPTDQFQGFPVTLKLR